jgi:predicted PurR-regulated permease PerM
MLSVADYFVANRIVWAMAGFSAASSGIRTGSILLGILVGTALVLTALVFFDTDRPWWADEVRRVVSDKERARTEVRALSLSTGFGLALGVFFGIASR